MDAALAAYLKGKFPISTDAVLVVPDEHYGACEALLRAVSARVPSGTWTVRRLEVDTEELAVDIETSTPGQEEVVAELCRQARDRIAVTSWQGGEIDGRRAREITGARSYGDLYRIAMEQGVELRFRPADVARRVFNGELTNQQGRNAMGIGTDAELEAFVSAWLA